VLLNGAAFAICLLATTLVPEIFLDFSSFLEAANTNTSGEHELPLRDSCFHCFVALSQLSHAEKNQEKPLGPG